MPATLLPPPPTTPNTTPLFPLGQTVTTRGALSAFQDAFGPLAGLVVADLLRRHECGDDGDLDPGDKAANRRAIRDEERIFSAYNVRPGIPAGTVLRYDADGCNAPVKRGDLVTITGQSGLFFVDRVNGFMLSLDHMRSETERGTIYGGICLLNTTVTHTGRNWFDEQNGADSSTFRVWIITEWDRSSTCVLLPEEY